MLLELRDVYKQYEGPEGPRVLGGVSLTLEAGDCVAVVGPSGSGKSTLLNIIGALDRPSSGAVLLEGRDLASLSDDELARIRNREIGFIFQDHHLLPYCTVWENTLVPALARARAPGPETEDRARRLLERVGLAQRAAHRPGELSVGERQRAAVVRALVCLPGLLLADEPTGALDRDSADKLSDLLLELGREQGTAMIVVTHAEELARRCPRRFELKRGLLEPIKP